jgi:hypothetical protein
MFLYWYNLCFFHLFYSYYINRPSHPTYADNCNNMKVPFSQPSRVSPSRHNRVLKQPHSYRTCEVGVSLRAGTFLTAIKHKGFKLLTMFSVASEESFFKVRPPHFCREGKLLAHHSYRKVLYSVTVSTDPCTRLTCNNANIQHLSNVKQKKKTKYISQISLFLCLFVYSFTARGVGDGFLEGLACWKDSVLSFCL